MLGGFDIVTPFITVNEQPNVTVVFTILLHGLLPAEKVSPELI